MFETDGQPLMLHPDFATGQRGRETLSCARFADRPDQVEPIWRFLAGRGSDGWHPPEPPVLDDEPNLRIVIGTREIRPVTVMAGHFWFVVPRGDAPARLVSRAARPVDARPWINDDRRLGVRVARLTHRNGRDERDVAIDDPMLDQGWWQVERDDAVLSRWTDGDAVLPHLGSGVLLVKLTGTMLYPKEALETDGRTPEDRYSSPGMEHVA